MPVATDKMKVSSYMDQELVLKLKVLSAMHGFSLSSYIEFLSQQAVDDAEKKGVSLVLPKKN